MQEERERGRIAGLTTRRLATAAWASDFILLLAEARLELPLRTETGAPALSAYAKWLNEKGHPSRRGGEWTAESVNRLLSIHIGLTEEAEKEFDIALGIIRFKRKHGSEGLSALDAEEALIKQGRARQINDANRLSASLRGHHYVDQDIPPRLVAEKTSRQGRRGRLPNVIERSDEPRGFN